jgi:hypothetical protein
MKDAVKMCAQSAIFNDVLDQIREKQIEVAKLADDDPLKPALRELFALHGEMTEKLRDGELDPGEVVKATRSAIEVLQSPWLHRKKPGPLDSGTP